MYLNDNGEITGFFGEILMELSYAANFSISKIIDADSYGNYDNEKNEWSGLLGLMAKGQGDIAVSEMTDTIFRRKFMDFTLPIVSSHYELYFRTFNGETINWLSYFQVNY